MSGPTVYDILSAIAVSSGISRGNTRTLLDAWINLAVTELNAGRAFSIPKVGRLVPNKSNRPGTVNPRTGVLIGTRLHRVVRLYPTRACIAAIN